ncbi:extracellular solute-binding protein [Pseudonocardiaceae bacterium YIM PH 21723]|nr:extracellular solute-binding protein [Pseudonocardiaceae bacterium YIM PH 21723]
MPVKRTMAVTLAVGLVVAGCGTGTYDPETPEAKAYFAAPCPEPGVKPASDKEFTYWSMWTKDEPQGKVLGKAVRCFQEKTGVKVKVQWLGRKGYSQNLGPALNTDNVPDLFDQDVTKVAAAIVTPGGTQSVEDVYAMKVGEGDKTVRDVLSPSSIDFPQNKDKDGNNFLVPYETLSSAWWFNRDQTKNVQQPKTMAELYSLFQSSQTKDRSAVSQDGDISFYNMYFFTQLAERFTGAGGLYAAASDRSGQSWRNPGLLKAAEETAKLRPFFIDGWDAAKFPQNQQRWADGDASFLYLGSWAPSEVREYLTKQGVDTKVTFGSFQFPMPEGATHDIVEQITIGFGVTKKAKHPEAAKAFAAYFLNKELLRGIPDVASNLVPRPDVDVPEDLKSLKAVLDDPAKEHVLQYDGLESLAGGRWTTDVFDPANLALLKGQLTPQQFIDRLASTQATFWRNQG